METLAITPPHTLHVVAIACVVVCGLWFVVCGLFLVLLFPVDCLLDSFSRHTN